MILMRLLFSLILLFGMILPVQAQDEVSPSVEEILERALARSSWYRTHEVEARLSSRVLRTSQDLNDEGNVDEAEERLYDVFPIGIYPFERLIEKDGEPLSNKELREQQKKEAEFREKVASGENPTDDEERSVTFNQKLIDKYNFTLEGTEEVNSRLAYVLAFKPRSEDLPVETRMDRALNKSFGKIWVDTEEFEVSRVKFELNEKIRIWWGLIGSISQVDGLVERKPLRDGIWVADRFQIYLKGRILFSSIHKIEKADWRSWEVPSDLDIPEAPTFLSSR